MNDDIAYGGLFLLVIGGALLASRFASVLYKWLLIAITAAGIGYLLVWFLWRLGGEIFSWHGLAWSFGLGSQDSLTFPMIVRWVTRLGVLEIAVLVSMFFDHRERRATRPSWLATLLRAHVGLVKRVLTVTVSASRWAWQTAADRRSSRVLSGRRFGELEADVAGWIAGSWAWLTDQLAEAKHGRSIAAPPAQEAAAEISNYRAAQ